MNFVNELAITRKTIYFKMLDELEGMKKRGLELENIYFIYKELAEEKDLIENKTVLKIVTDQIESSTKNIKYLEEKIINFAQNRFSKSELEALKMEYSLRQKEEIN